MPLTLTDITKEFGSTPALRGVSLEVRDGEFLALLGPSGSGKTTLLRILAGLARPDAGSVRFNDEDFLALSPRARKAGMVFQHYALFRHMTVAENIAFGLKVRPRKERPTREAIKTRVAELLRLIQLEDLGGRYPAQLSGGQQQRVALARALAIEPRILLLDEPFGALDAKVRRELRHWLRRVHDETGVTTIFVTHDQEEALDLADRVAILSAGQIEQLGAPQEVYEQPATPFVFDFLGAANQIKGEVKAGRLLAEGCSFPLEEACADGPVTAFFRPHEVDVNPEDGEGLACVVATVAARGAAVKVECRCNGRLFDVEWSGRELPAHVKVGAKVKLAPKRFRVFAG
ncbi:sulfate transport system ATP-binding protein [Caulobacter ginsengisoli]|uniref:Sulfate transport system ATP-binding protein n=1 Tax=Caulobacter ginsengisoli TaxID=400775 RepID=A0ABU0IT56_9CAUL|nr:sulfate/molybdate ABC transporter ATP-binding protein [Caulobacter ginsengisoli]MDQ0465170.1 sulfate transport system ATP-binding protein [Caulobacter ginsengisoli]